MIGIPSCTDATATHVRCISRLRAVTGATLVALALLSFWYRPAQAQAAAQFDCRPIHGPAYLGGRDEAKTSVVVFVHGVLSSALEAWSSSPGQSWPCLLRSEPIFDNSNIYLYGYDTNLRGANPSVDKLASQLLKDLQTDQVLSHAHVTLVAHSMGGLIVSRMLLKMHADPDRRAQLNRIKLVQFHGTPATGADIANVASIVSDSVQIKDMMPGEDRQFIDNWLAVNWPFPWYCLAEGKRTGWSWLLGTMVVPVESATALCRTRKSGVELLERYDHLTIVKPVSILDTPHRAFRRNFSACVQSGRPPSAPPSEAGAADGQLMLRTLTALRTSLSDDTEDGRKASLSAVQAALYKSSAWAEAYVMPSNPKEPMLLTKAFDRLQGRPFAVEFLRLFQSHPAGLSPVWVGRLGLFEKFVPDGLLIELRRDWISAGLVEAGDLVAALEPGSHGEQVIIISSIQQGASGNREARIRGLLIVPPSPSVCD